MSWDSSKSTIADYDIQIRSLAIERVTAMYAAGIFVRGNESNDQEMFYHNVESVVRFLETGRSSNIR